MGLHDLNQACRYADYLVAITKGNIYAQGKPEVVMNETMILEVFGLECNTLTDPVLGTPMCLPISRRHKMRQ